MKLFSYALCVFFVLCFSVSSMRSMVFYAHLIGPKGERLQIIGDHHGLPKAYAYEAMDAFVNTAKKLKLAKPLPVAVEIHESYLDDASLMSEISVMPSLERLIRHRDEPACTLIAIERRGIVSDIINGLFSWIYPLVQRFMACNWQDELPELHHALQEAVQEAQKTLMEGVTESLSCSDILASYQAMLKDMKKYEGLYGATPLASVVRDATRRFEQALAELKKFVGENKRFDTLFFSQIAQCKTFAAFFEEYKRLNAMLRQDTEYVFADFSFLKRMLEIFEQGQRRAVLTVGVSHAEKLVPLFIKLGWSVAKQVSVFTKRGDEYHIIMDDTAQFIGDFVATMESFLQVHCENCSKKENLKLCSRCKTVYYCGPECQKAGWSTHKGNCKPEVKSLSTHS